MTNSVNLLDCTLRDGGYVNDWNFGHSVITGTYKRLDKVGVEYIEVGFLDDRRPFDINRSIFPDTESINKIYGSIQKKNAIPVAMIDYGTCSLDNIGSCEDSFIDGIRVIFKKEKIEEALPYCQAIKNKGYKLFIQAISITAYSDLELLEYVQKINAIKPYAFSIVDTYGLLDKSRLTKYFYLIDNNLDPDIVLGYHAHNNFQLGFSNTIEFLSMRTKRTLVADSTVYGMGKSAGNCATELLTMHMNQYYDKQYQISEVLEIIDTDLMTIYREQYWGYTYMFYISALHDCHPNYVQYLLNKKTLSVSAINEILASIPLEKKLLFDKEYIRQSYTLYQAHEVDDTNAVEILSEKLKGKKILVLGPGKSIVDQKKDIDGFLKTENPIVISVNFSADNYKTDYVFMSNAKRYSKLADILTGKSIDAELIATSNIKELDYPIQYKLNYEALLLKNIANADNALVLCLNFLIKAGVLEVYLAGFDGYKPGIDNYYEKEYNFVNDDSFKLERNRLLSNALSILAEKLNIKFLTKTLYSIEDGVKND